MTTNIDYTIEGDLTAVQKAEALIDFGICANMDEAKYFLIDSGDAHESDFWERED